jgi:hypothetical protein
MWKDILKADGYAVRPAGKKVSPPYSQGENPEGRDITVYKCPKCKEDTMILRGGMDDDLEYVCQKESDLFSEKGCGLRLKAEY